MNEKFRKQVKEKMEKLKKDYQKEKNITQKAAINGMLIGLGEALIILNNINYEDQNNAEKLY